MTNPKLTAAKDSVRVSLAKKELALLSDSRIPVLLLTNEYGNSVSYEWTSNAFERLHAELWGFVKDSQH